MNQYARILMIAALGKYHLLIVIIFLYYFISIIIPVSRSQPYGFSPFVISDDAVYSGMRFSYNLDTLTNRYALRFRRSFFFFFNKFDEKKNREMYGNNCFIIFDFVIFFSFFVVVKSNCIDIMNNINKLAISFDYDKYFQLF